MNSASTRLAPLRSSLVVELHRHEDRDVVLLRDEEGIAESDIMLDATLLPLLNGLDGTHTLGSLHQALLVDHEATFSITELSAFINALDEACLLDSEFFLQQKLFLDSDVRHPVCSGTCYPSDPVELAQFLDEILAMSPVRSYPTQAKAVLAPHIDFRVNKEVYAAPFNALRDAEFDVVIHIGTSHYGWNDRFILSEKDFLTPLGRLRSDKDLIRELRSRMSNRLTTNDSAHQPEHSLEFHHIFLQHLFPNRDFSIVPILVSSFQDFVNVQREPQTDSKVKEFCDTLNKVVEESNKKALWLVSGDLAHIGKRFGDEWEAVSLLDTLRSEDFEVMNSMINGKAYEYFGTIARNHDRRRICGLPPVWTMLNSVKPGKGTALGYDQWNDSPTASAVSFGAAAWW